MLVEYAVPLSANDVMTQCRRSWKRKPGNPAFFVRVRHSARQLLRCVVGSNPVTLQPMTICPLNVSLGTYAAKTLDIGVLIGAGRLCVSDWRPRHYTEPLPGTIHWTGESHHSALAAELVRPSLSGSRAILDRPGPDPDFVPRRHFSSQAPDFPARELRKRSSTWPKSSTCSKAHSTQNRLYDRTVEQGR